MQTIYLDISNKGVTPILYAKQNDVGRKFIAVITESGIQRNISESENFSAWYFGESGEGNYTHIGENSAFSVTGNKVEVELITQMLSNSGNGLFSLVLHNSSGEQIGLWNIPYYVEELPGSESESATEYYTAFSEDVKNAVDAAKRAETAAGKLENITPHSIGALSVGGGNMNGWINMTGNGILNLREPDNPTHAATKNYVDNTVNAAVKIAAPVNLLDNSDFRNPVNQRGQAKYMENYGYTIDRWFAYHISGKLHVSTEHDGYLKVWAESSGDATFTQRFPKGVLSADKKYTFAYKRATGIITIDTNPVHFGDSYDWVEIYLTANQTLNLVWAALYEGEYTAATLPEYHPKGYAHESAECRRYYQNDVRINIFQTHEDYFAASYNHNMRIVPTMTFVHVDIYGKNVLTDFTNAVADIGTMHVGYVKIPTMISNGYTNGSLLCSLSAEL